MCTLNAFTRHFTDQALSLLANILPITFNCDLLSSPEPIFVYCPFCLLLLHSFVGFVAVANGMSTYVCRGFSLLLIYNYQTHFIS